MKPLILSLCATLLLAACTTPTETKPNLQESLTNVVLISNEGSIGTGWWMEDGSIVTAQHVVAEGMLPSAMTRDGKTFGLKVVASNKESDLARLIPTQQITAPRGLKVCVNAPATGQEVWGLGHPLHVDWVVTHGYVGDPFNKTRVGNYQIIDLNIASGDSGGPIITADTGCVIGIMDGMLSRGEREGRVFIAISHHDLIAFLKESQGAK